ncbi:MAG: acyltransferase [Tannerellaceae bacterium]
MKTLAYFIYWLFLAFRGCSNRCLKYWFKHLFISIGRDVHFSPLSSFFSYSNISVGSNVYIGPKANFMAVESVIYIGNNILFGPNVTIIGGDHKYDTIGKCIINEHTRDKSSSGDVVIEDDVWIGANVLILKGVTIARGSIVAAGSVVSKDVQPYSIYAGVPAKLIRRRFTINQIIQHESALYSDSKRLSESELASIDDLP